MIAKSYERIHRTNLIGMGVLPLQFKDGEGGDELGLSGFEKFTIRGLSKIQPGRELTVIVEGDAGTREFEVDVRLDTKIEVDYYRHGGILPYVLRNLISETTA